MNTRLTKKIQDSIRTLRVASQRAGGPEEITHAFTNAGEYPDFDNDPEANHEIGWLQGVAEALGVDVLNLIGSELPSHALLALATPKAMKQYPVGDWQAEVRSGDTHLGYTEWVAHNVESHADDESAR